MPVHTFTNWNSRASDQEIQIEPFRKYYFICEGANTETFYFERLIGLRKQLGIHPLIDIRLLEKTDEDRNLSFPKLLAEFAEEQKIVLGTEFDSERDKMVIVFDADIFEEKVEGYDDLVSEIEQQNVLGITNPGFELFLLLHIQESYEQHIAGNEARFLTPDENGSYSYAFRLLRELTGMNAKKNSRIGELADNVLVAIEQEKKVNEDVHSVKGQISSNIGAIINAIIQDTPLPF